jgi:UDP-N-acetylmuramoyl-tripeptide--D-alanyl-D-alanine ligase
MMKLSQAATILNATLRGADAEFDSVSTDTRTLKSGELFIALQGPKFNAHDFIEQAAEIGAAGAIVSDAVEEMSLPTIRVSDTKIALAQLASYQRDQVDVPVIAVTGSVGKTTTRAMLASVFRQCGNVLASESSFNNDIGVPLTLLRLRPDHDFAIFELGANHPGEIAYLTQLVKPTVAMITNAGPAHLEGFGDIEGVACAKGEIFQGLDPEGTAIINNDDRYASLWRNLVVGSQIITFGIKNTADVMATNIRVDAAGHPIFHLVLPDAEIDITLPLMGEHNVINALAVAAAAYVFNLPIETIKKGLESVVPVKGRLVVRKGYRGATIIDDSYNANPSSVGAAIKVLANRPGNSVLVFGDMRELGQSSEQFHREIGEQALRSGIKRLYCYGPLSRHTVNAFGNNAFHFENKETLISAVKNNLDENVTVLVKGSLSMGMSQVAAALVDETGVK